MVNVNCPVTGTINATGTGTLQVQLTGSYDFAVAADRTFVLEVDPASFANYFLKIETPADASQNHIFSLLNSSEGTLVKALKDGLATSVAGVTGGDNQYSPFNAGNKKLVNYIKNWAQVSINSSLDADGLGAFLSAEEIKDLTFDDFDAACEAGAGNLWGSLASKLPELAYQYKDDEFWRRDASGDAVDPMVLPLQEDDTMTFRFVISSTFNISPEYINAPTDLTEDSQPTLSAYTIPGNKQVDIVLKFKAGGEVTTSVDSESPIVAA